MYTICVITGTRAEYGLLRPVLQKLFAKEDIDVRLLVTGAHLSRKLGNTVDEIQNDENLGIKIDAKLDFLSAHVRGGRFGIAQQVALVINGCTSYFSEIKPDVVLVLGDRYEIFAASQAAAILDIPLAHISGGDVTSGADDDWFRHCISKMSKLHFPSCEEYRQRLLRMGEQPDTVFNVGGLGDENIRSLNLLPFNELQESLDFKLSQPYALVTFHPETVGRVSAEEQTDALLLAMQQNPQLFYLCTKANADIGGEEINKRLEIFCKINPNAVLVSSLGTMRYLSAMKHSALVLGNSSSGIVETPSLGTPTVNIGGRQKGRTQCGNILNCEADTDEISAAIKEALTPQFTQNSSRTQSPYNKGDTSGTIVQLLEKFLETGLLKRSKIFYDGEE